MAKVHVSSAAGTIADTGDQPRFAAAGCRGKPGRPALGSGHGRDLGAMADLNDVAGSKPWGGWRATASDAARVFGFASLPERGAVLGLSVIYGVLDLVSLTMLVPLLAAAADVGGSNKNAVVALRTMFAQFQLPFEAPIILAAVLTGLALKALTGIVLQRLVQLRRRAHEPVGAA